jgi:hypothetical protein
MHATSSSFTDLISLSIPSRHSFQDRVQQVSR